MFTYKHYYIFILLGTLIPALLYLSLGYLQLGVPTESSRWTYEICSKKIRIAQLKSATPKIIILSGSNSLFGIRTQTIEQQTGIPSVNVGTHAGLGLDYIIHLGRIVSKHGDLVLMPLEYELYASPSLPNVTNVDYFMSRDPSYLRSLGPLTELRFFFAATPKRILKGVITKLSNRQPERSSGGYQSQTLNANGDETNNHETERNPQAVALDKVKEIKIDSGARRRLAFFAEWCKQRNITLIATYPSTIYHKEYETPLYRKRFKKISLFYQEIGIPILGCPHDFLYDRSYFYDTDYHLTDRAMTSRTKKIISLLGPYTTKLLARQRCDAPPIFRVVSP